MAGYLGKSWGVDGGEVGQAEQYIVAWKDEKKNERRSYVGRKKRNGQARQR